METVPPPPPGSSAAPGSPGSPGAPSAPGSSGGRAVSSRRRPWDDGAVVGGVGRDLAVRLGSDPLWIRLAFVLLTLFSGLGVVLYAGLWCVLRGIRRGSLATFWGLAGIAICVFGTMGLLASATTEYLGGPWSLVFALSGVAVALWVPRQSTEAAAWSPPDATSRADGTDGTGSTLIGGLAVPSPHGARLPAVTPRPPSLVGRWTLAIALIVILVGMVIDELNDGRLHPEQWFGAGAIVCGIGIVVSAWRGFAMWLVVPALAFAAAGFVTGHAARAGLDEVSIGSQHFTIWSDGSTDLPTWQASSDLLGGEIDLWIDGAVDDGRRIPDLRVAIGSVEIWSDASLAVDVIGRVHSGTILGVDGREVQSDGDWHTHRLGPDGPADVVVRAEVSVGDLRLHQMSGLDMSLPRPPQLAPPRIPSMLDVPMNRPEATSPSAASGADIGGGFTMTADGTVIFPNATGGVDEQVWMSPNGDLGGPVGDPTGPNGVTTVYAADGSEYLVLPNQAIVTPDGMVIDVAALREQHAEEDLAETETNRPAAASESGDESAPNVSIAATTPSNEQD